MYIDTTSYTPTKSQVVTNINGLTRDVKIKFINKKGSIKRREQCSGCKFRGTVQIGLGFAFSASCDREEGFWRELTGKTNRDCKYFQTK